MSEKSCESARVFMNGFGEVADLFEKAERGVDASSCRAPVQREALEFMEGLAR